MSSKKRKQWRVVFDDLPERTSALLGPVAGTLSYAVTFTAASKEEAERIVTGGVHVALGRWHVEEVP